MLDNTRANKMKSTWNVISEYQRHAMMELMIKIEHGGSVW